MLGTFFASYIGIGFAYPLAFGESAIHTAFRKAGWIPEEIQNSNNNDDNKNISKGGRGVQGCGP